MNNILAILGAGELGQQIANFALNDNHYDNYLIDLKVFYDELLEKISDIKVTGEEIAALKSSGALRSGDD